MHAGESVWQICKSADFNKCMVNLHLQVNLHMNVANTTQYGLNTRNKQDLLISYRE